MKERRRRDNGTRSKAHDDAVTAATATGSPESSTTRRSACPLAADPRAVAGTLRKPRACYTCKQRYT